MLRVGLTGGLGSGKSTVAACLRELGASACLLLPIPMEGGSWGMVACLNREAAMPSLESRAVAELVVAFLSLNLRIALRPTPSGPDFTFRTNGSGHAGSFRAHDALAPREPTARRSARKSAAIAL